ncbi:FGGY family carbohydrate kinase [Agrococcus sp. SGAir0287]|uniref:FGGY family carbohydrate kinase n=1 Tax=Agrococcus sp. SGAir0287 TaxID=2070347 RepID=UPI0010F87AF0|nr:FGGY family carbohydrate kinase [Agrococcus sp. SGAir0287]
MTSPVFLAVDAGTGSARAIAFDASGAQVARGSREWSHRPLPGHPGGTTFDVDGGWAAIAGAIRDVVEQLQGRAVAAVAASSMREGFVLFDADDRPIFACPNTDGRARAQAGRLAADGRADRIYAVGGDWVSITAPARLLWLAEHEPETLAAARTLGMLSDWAGWCLTGVHATDPTCGSSTALFDLATRTWSAELVDAIDVDARILPEVRECGTPLGVVTPEASAATGLAIGTPVAVGGADTQLALHGLGADVRVPTLVSGTFWQTTLVTREPRIDPERRLRTLCHVDPGTWMTEGIGFLNGLAFRWLRDVAYSEVPAGEGFATMDADAASVPAGSGGLVAVLANVMQADAWHHAPPSFVGLDVSDAHGHGRAALVRAVEEAAAYVARGHLGILAELEPRIDLEQLLLTGGASSGVAWPRIIAEATGRAVSRSPVPDATSLGAARLAARSVGAEVAAAEPLAQRIVPEPDAIAAYDRHAETWFAATDAQVRAGRLAGIDPLFEPPGGGPYRAATAITPSLLKEGTHG